MAIVPSENRLYNKLTTSDTLQWTGGGSNPNSIINYELKKGEVKILGYNCDILIVYTKTGKYTYYFGDKIKIDPRHYRDHKYSNWALVTGRTGSLPLKIEVQTPQFTMVGVATEIKKMEIEVGFFELPDLPSIESPY